MTDKHQIKEIIENFKEDLVKHRRNLHRIPEIGLKLPKTIEYIKKELDSSGIKYRETKTVDGVYGLIEGKNRGKIIAVRSDMDALPIREKTGLSFASDNGNMHACGHDGHMAVMLLTLRILNQIKDNLDGSVMFIFQPGEEGYLGAEKMLKEDLFKDIKPDVIFSSHVGSIFDELGDGEFGIGFGKVMSSLDTFSLKMTGKESHGAEPYKARDPFIATAEILLGVQSIVSREINTKESAVVSFGKIEGGTAANIIPKSIELEGTVRCTDENIRNYINNRIEEIAYHTAKAYRADIDYNYIYGAPVLENNKDLVKEFIEVLRENMPENEYKILDRPTMIGEDFSYFLKEIPGFYYFFGSKRLIDGAYHAHHTEKFDINEENLYKVVYINIMFILKYLSLDN